jgi:lipoate-protein ligase A
MEPGLVRRLIRIGRERVSSLGVRSAEKEVSPLTRWTDRTREQIVQALIDCFRVRTAAPGGRLTGQELDEARQLALSKYAAREWIDRLG